MGISLIFTYQDGGSARLDNLLATANFYYDCFPNWQTIIVEQGNEATLTADQFDGSPELIFAFNDTAFNKSWAVNIGYHRSSGKILVIADADLLVAPEDLQRSIEAVNGELEIVRPFRQLIDLSREQSKCFFRDKKLAAEPPQEQGYDRGYIGESLCLAGGQFVIKRSFFELLNGFDERFQGWGGEDDAFSLKAHSLTKRAAILKEGVAWHLWHPRASIDDSPHYQNNCQLLRDYRLELAQKDSPILSHKLDDLGRLDKFLT